MPTRPTVDQALRTTVALTGVAEFATAALATRALLWCEVPDFGAFAVCALIAVCAILCIAAQVHHVSWTSVRWSQHGMLLIGLCVAIVLAVVECIQGALAERLHGIALVSAALIPFALGGLAARRLEAAAS